MPFPLAKDLPKAVPFCYDPPAEALPNQFKTLAVTLNGLSIRHLLRIKIDYY